MSKEYNENLYESIQHPDFFNQSQLELVRSGYWNLYNDVIKDQNLTLADDEYFRINEVNFLKHDDIDWCQIVGKIYDTTEYKVQQKIQIDFNQNEPMRFIESYKDWLHNIIEIMEQGFAEIGRPSKIKAIAFHNFSAGLKIHCDGQDINVELKRAVPRPSNHPNYTKEQYQPGMYTKYAHQGLINIDSLPDKATIIFDQWFPYSTYYDIINTVETLDEPARPVISFAKDESLERFDEHIRDLTGKTFNRKHYIEMIESRWQNELPLAKFHGLSLNKILYFGQPGTLISWDNKRYHMAKPFLVHGHHGIGSENRLMLQYESVCL